MTLVLCAANPYGVWQVSDRRVVKFVRGQVREVIDDRTIKHVSVWCTDGVALIAYAGLAYLGRQHLSEWIHSTLLGKRLSLMEVIEALTEAATNRFGVRCHDHGIPHAFVLGGAQHGKTWVGAIANHDRLDPVGSITMNFRSGGFGVSAPIVHAAGSGMSHVPPTELAKVQRALTATGATPTSRKRLRTLMAYVNRRTAETTVGSKTVSRECVSVSLDDQLQVVASSFYWSKSDEKSVAIPALMLGADATTADSLTRGWQQFIDFETTTPEAQSELEATIDGWVDERLVELPASGPRLHRPRPLHRRKSA